MISRLPSRKWNLISLVDDNVTSILIHSALIPVVYQEKEIILVQKCSQPSMTWKNLKEVTDQAKVCWERRPEEVLSQLGWLHDLSSAIRNE